MISDRPAEIGDRARAAAAAVRSHLAAIDRILGAAEMIAARYLRD